MEFSCLKNIDGREHVLAMVLLVGRMKMLIKGTENPTTASAIAKEQ